MCVCVCGGMGVGREQGACKQLCFDCCWFGVEHIARHCPFLPAMASWGEGGCSARCGRVLITCSPSHALLPLHYKHTAKHIRSTPQNALNKTPQKHIKSTPHHNHTPQSHTTNTHHTPCCPIMLQGPRSRASS